MALSPPGNSILFPEDRKEPRMGILILQIHINHRQGTNSSNTGIGLAELLFSIANRHTVSECQASW